MRDGTPENAGFLTMNKIPCGWWLPSIFGDSHRAVQSDEFRKIEKLMLGHHQLWRLLG